MGGVLLGTAGLRVAEAEDAREGPVCCCLINGVDLEGGDLAGDFAREGETLFALATGALDGDAGVRTTRLIGGVALVWLGLVGLSATSVPLRSGAEGVGAGGSAGGSASGGGEGATCSTSFGGSLGGEGGAG